MNLVLKELKNIISEDCITIIMNTHRTKPDNERDHIVLKNLIREAEERLLASSMHKRDALALGARLNDLAATIDHNYNLESLVLFVNDEVSQYTRLPIAVEDRVVIGHKFATRDLIRALHLESNYYVLVLSQQKVRLIEAFNDKVVAEVGGSFPIENNQFYSTNRAELSNASRQTSLIAEFFNRIDKAVNEVRHENPLPVLICTEEGNYHEYLKVADQKQSIFETHLNKNRLEEKAHAIVSEAWEIVKAHVKSNNDARINEIENAVSRNMFLSDTNEIWQGIKQGRIQTLFIEEGKFQPATIKDDVIHYVVDDRDDDEGLVDDIYDELIVANSNFGGEVVFLPKGKLDAFEGFGAIARF